MGGFEWHSLADLGQIKAPPGPQVSPQPLDWQHGGRPPAPTPSPEPGGGQDLLLRPEVAFVIDGFCAFPTPSCMIDFPWGGGLGLVHCGEFKHSQLAWMSLEAKYTGPRRLAAHLLAPLVHSTPGPQVSTTGVSPHLALVHKLPPGPSSPPRPLSPSASPRHSQADCAPRKRRGSEPPAPPTPPPRHRCLLV